MALNLLLVKGARGVSTRALFEGLSLPLPLGDAGGAAAALRAGDVQALAARVFNTLTAPVTRLVPEIARYADRLRAEGALAVCMTGSGSAVFGLFESRADAERAKGAFPDAAFTHVCRTLPFSHKT